MIGWLLEGSLSDVSFLNISGSESHQFRYDFIALQPLISCHSGLVCGEIRVKIFIEGSSPAGHLEGDVLNFVLVTQSDCSADLLDVDIKTLLGQKVKTFLRLVTFVLLDVCQRFLLIFVEAIDIDINFTTTRNEQKVVLSVEIYMGNT